MQIEEFFTELRVGLNSEFPMVVYRLPGKKPVKLMIQKNKEVFRLRDFTESGFVLAPFISEDHPIYIPTEYSKVLELPAFKGENITTNSESKEEISEASKQEYLNLIEKALSQLEKDNFRKVVLSRKEEVCHSLSAEQLFKNLLVLYSNAFVYLWSHPETGIWLGATPETLLKTERNRFSTMSLAGTRKASEIVKKNWTAKEREEQQIVTDAILSELNELGYQQPDLDLKFEDHSAAGNLVHLRTDISGTLITSDIRQVGKIIKAFHPTPAVCGLPREKAFEFIHNNENYDREFYTGYLGELNTLTESKRNSRRNNQENQQFASIVRSSYIFVNLRCLKFENDLVRIFVGGGITKDSVAIDEWEETVNKSKTMKAAL